MPDAYALALAVVTWGPLALRGFAAAELVAPRAPVAERPPSLLPLRIEGADDQGRPARVDAPAEVLAGDEPGVYTFRAYEDPDLPWPTRRISVRVVPGSESDVALRRLVRSREEARA